MTEAHEPTHGSGPHPGADDEAPHQEPVVRDRRRIDPDTGAVRDTSTHHGRHEAPEEEAAPTTAADAEALGGEAATLAAERLADLQRLQAEYVNYRRRVERDRDVARDSAVAGVVESLLPVLDDVYFARVHGDLTDGPFAAIAEKLEGVLARYGVERYGEVGEEFDPAVHEALMHQHSADVTVTTVTQVMQPGYRVGEKVLRPARVGVSDPEG
ncbi:nucleotide exchange factor GrpE [Thalassiella azotivora]